MKPTRQTTVLLHTDQPWMVPAKGAEQGGLESRCLGVVQGMESDGFVLDGQWTGVPGKIALMIIGLLSDR